MERSEIIEKLRELTRYNDGRYDYECGSEPEESPSGVWVYFDDVVDLFEEAEDGGEQETGTTVRGD